MKMTYSLSSKFYGCTVLLYVLHYVCTRIYEFTVRLVSGEKSAPVAIVYSARSRGFFLCIKVNKILVIRIGSPFCLIFVQLWGKNRSTVGAHENLPKLETLENIIFIN
jgi:hypothetical protein